MEQSVFEERPGCEETHGMIGDLYLRCGLPTVMVVQHRGRDEGPYAMCLAHGTHNAENRDAEIVLWKDGCAPEPGSAMDDGPDSRPVVPFQKPRGKGGKYAAVVTGLPAMPAVPAYQEKVDAAKAKVTDRSAAALAASYARLRLGSGTPIDDEFREAIIDDLGKAGLEALVYEVNLRIEARSQLLVESQAAAEPGWGAYGVKPNALRLPDGSTIRVQHEPYPRVADKEAFRKWCLANGYGRQLQLWPSTMAAISKERLLAAMPQPDGVEVFGVDKVTFTKAESKE